MSTNSMPDAIYARFVLVRIDNFRAIHNRDLAVGLSNISGAPTEEIFASSAHMVGLLKKRRWRMPEAHYMQRFMLNVAGVPIYPLK